MKSIKIIVLAFILSHSTVHCTEFLTANDFSTTHASRSLAYRGEHATCRAMIRDIFVFKRITCCRRHHPAISPCKVFTAYLLKQ